MSAKDGLRRVTEEAEALGFSISRTRNGHLRFDLTGVPAVFFSSTPGDHRAILNGVAKLRRAKKFSQTA